MLAQVGLVGALMDILKPVCCVLAASVCVSVIVDEVFASPKASRHGGKRAGDVSA